MGVICACFCLVFLPSGGNVLFQRSYMQCNGVADYYRIKPKCTNQWDEWLPTLGNS